jgi:maleamate amidohydrolase
MSFGFRPVVISDCVGDRAQAPHDASLFDIGQKYGDVVASEQILAWSSAANDVSPRQSL